MSNEIKTPRSTPTPRTDAAVQIPGIGRRLVALAILSKKLEIEMVELREANKAANAAIGDIANECKKYAEQLSEQVKLHDVAFQALFERNNKITEERLKSSKHLYELTLQNEIRWMQAHSKSEEQLKTAVALLGDLLHAHRFSLGDSSNSSVAINLVEEKVKSFLESNKPK